MTLTYPFPLRISRRSEMIFSDAICSESPTMINFIFARVSATLVRRQFLNCSHKLPLLIKESPPVLLSLDVPTRFYWNSEGLRYPCQCLGFCQSWISRRIARKQKKRVNICHHQWSISVYSKVALLNSYSMSVVRRDTSERWRRNTERQKLFYDLRDKTNLNRCLLVYEDLFESQWQSSGR